VADTAERGEMVAIVEAYAYNAQVDLTTRRQNRLRTLCHPGENDEKKKGGEQMN
jgi:hypothetical protein